MSQSSSVNGQKRWLNKALYTSAVGLLLGMILLFIVQLLWFLIGAMIGLMGISHLKTKTRYIDQLKAFFGTITISYFIIYICFGFSGSHSSDFSGVLSQHQWYLNFVAGFNYFWNEKILALLHWSQTSLYIINSENRSKTVIPSAIAGTVSSVFLPTLYKLIFRKIKISNNDQVSNDKSIISILSELSYIMFYYIIETPLTRLIFVGHFYAVKLRSINLRAIFHIIIVFLLLLGVGSLVEKVPTLFNLQSTELYKVANFIAGLPILSFLIGIIIGLIPVLGDTALFHLFGSSPTGSTVLQLKKPELHGFVLGYISRNNPYLLTEKNISHHIQIVAPSGGGKTNIIKNFIQDRIRNGHGILFLDYKADFELAEFIYTTAKEMGRENEMRLFSLSNREISVPYNPISHGGAAELQSRLMNSFQWSEPYYRSKAESALLKLFRGLCELRDLGKITITLKTVYTALTKKGYTRELSQNLKLANGSQWEALEDLAQTLDRPSDSKDLQGLVTNLEKIIYGGAGELLTDDAENGSFTVEEAIQYGKISYFLMNSLSHKETANCIGKLLLQDLMGYVGRSYDSGASKNKPITVIIDEFSEFALPEFPSFLNRVRGAGIGVMIAHQTRGDLTAISPDYQNKIEANTNTKIVAGVIDPMDAQFYAQLIGTQTVTKETHQINENAGLLALGDVKTGIKSVREVEEFIIHPNRIKQIEQGEALVISRTVDVGYGLIAIPKAPEFHSENTYSEMSDCLKAIRSSYIKLKQPGLKTDHKSTAQEIEHTNLWA